MQRWIGLEVESHEDAPQWHGRKYEPMPPVIYGKGYYCKWRFKWVFYPIPLCYIIRLGYSVISKLSKEG